MLLQFNLIYDITLIREQCINIFGCTNSLQINSLLTTWVGITLAEIHALPAPLMLVNPLIKDELRQYPDLQSLESLLYQITPIPWGRLQISANFNCSIAIMNNDLILTFM